MQRWLYLILVLLILSSAQAWAGPKGSGLTGGSLGINKPLEVKGQNRSLAMLQATKADKTKIGFVQARKNFRPQILSTVY